MYMKNAKQILKSLIDKCKHYKLKVRFFDTGWENIIQNLTSSNLNDPPSLPFTDLAFVYLSNLNLMNNLYTWFSANGKLRQNIITCYFKHGD